MRSQNQQNTIETVLTRLGMESAISKFREMNVSRIVSLRKLSEEQLRQVVPNDEERKKLMQAINCRGNIHQPRRGTDPDQPYPPRMMSDAHLTGGRGDIYKGNMIRGRGRGGGRSRGNGESNVDDVMRPCRHYFSPEGCKYTTNCRYSHDESLRQQFEENEAEYSHLEDTRPPHEVCMDVTIPTEHVKFLIGVNGNRLKEINTKFGTSNDRFSTVDESIKDFTIKVYGKTTESVQAAIEAMKSAVGLRSRTERKARFEYVINELEINTRAVKLFAACNILNEGTPRHLSAEILRNVISAVRFPQPQRIRHFFISSTNGDREKLDVVSNIISQLQGVQAIMFCEQKRVESFSTQGGIQRLTKHFNGVQPKFLFRSMTKEVRMQNLEEFKRGVENDNGVKQRLLVTNEDYAKLARKTVIPFVNLVINLTVPRAEFYVTQSLVAGRQGTVGISFQFVSQQDANKFDDIKELVNFEEYTNEQEFREAVLQLSYDTRETPLTPPDAEPPEDWREHLNDPKPQASQHKRH